MDSPRIEAESRGTVLVAGVHGDLDIVSSRQLDDCLLQARREHHDVVVALDGVTFMDTSALAVIVRHWKALAGEKRVLALAGARYRSARSLWITGLASRLPLYDTVDEAVTAIAVGTPEAGPPRKGAAE